MEERGRQFGFRALGCLLAFVVFIALFSLPEMLGLNAPPIPLALLSIAAGVGCLALYVRAVRRRWGVDGPDVVQLLERDLGSVRRRRINDYRLRLGGDWPFKERALHEALYGVKWLGHFLVFAGAGWLIYRLMVLVGLVHE